MFLVVDIGGTKTRAAVSRDGKALGEVMIWETPADFEVGINLLIQNLLDCSKNIQISEIGVGIAGVVDKQAKKLVKSPHLPKWVDKPLGSRLEKALGVKVLLENDAALAALGEAVFGAGRRAEIVGYLTISTGIGGARVVDGRIDKKSVGFEPGHMIIDVGNKVGYWEDFASGTAMEKIYKVKPEENSQIEAWENEARLIAIGLHNCIVMWSPDCLVLGGSLMKSVDIELVKKLVTEQMTIFPKLPEITLSELGEKTGLFGALALMQRDF